jgi:transposase
MMDPWAPGPEICVDGAERVDDGWLALAVGQGRHTCPDCGELSTSRHSWHHRRLQDLPVQGLKVMLDLRIGRWRCRNLRCERQTFVERLPDTAVPAGRRTRRVIELLQLLGHTAGGRPGEMLAARFGILASDNTILRLLKRWSSSRARAAVPVVGIDNWSWCKGQKFGTIIVDLKQYNVVEVIADRSMETAADWFAGHPEVEVVCRDRCGLYSKGTSEGAPQARQVVDWFHVLQNLKEAIEGQLSRVSRFAGRSLLSETDSRGASGLEDDVRPSRRIQREARIALFDRVQALYAAGKTLRGITTTTGVGRPTVRR